MHLTSRASKSAMGNMKQGGVQRCAVLVGTISSYVGLNQASYSWADPMVVQQGHHFLWIFTCFSPDRNVWKTLAIARKHVTTNKFKTRMYTNASSAFPTRTWDAPDIGSRLQDFKEDSSNCDWGLYPLKKLSTKLWWKKNGFGHFWILKMSKNGFIKKSFENASFFEASLRRSGKTLKTFDQKCLTEEKTDRPGRHFGVGHFSGHLFWDTLFCRPMFMWLNIVSTLHDEMIGFIICSVSFVFPTPYCTVHFRLLDYSSCLKNLP